MPNASSPRALQIMGIVNCTPDSFSDGGQYNPASHMRQLVEHGADIIDVGAESTRPGAEQIHAEAEWSRLAPLLEVWNDLRREHPNIKLSLDTRHAETARRALDYGIDILNDVTGLTQPAMIEVAQNAALDLVVMHSLSIPADPGLTLPEDANPITHMQTWQEHTVDRLAALGIASHRLILDPGIGFGLTAQQSIMLLRHARELQRTDTRLLIGHSRKSFMKQFTDAPAEARDIETHSISIHCWQQGVDMIRVHDVAGTKRSLNAFIAVAEPAAPRQ